MKNNLLYLAMFLLILCVPLRGNDEGVRWLWTDLPLMPIILVFVSLVSIGRYIYKKEKMEKRSKVFKN